MVISAVSFANVANKINQAQCVKNSSDYVPERFSFKQDVKDKDSFQSFTNEKALEAKYDLACRLAAYYKSNYEKLAKEGCCSV